MNDQSSSEKIIKSYPELTPYNVEYDGTPFDCNKCRTGEDNCCAAHDKNNSNYLACQKCRCQHLHNVIDDSRTERVKDLGCKNCDDSQFNTNYCTDYGNLNNNLKANITDCSNNFLNVGNNSTITDVELRSECNIGGEKNVDVITPSTSTQSQLPAFNMNHAYMGGGVLLLLLMLWLLFG